jgi:hypothetical protein
MGLCATAGRERCRWKRQQAYQIDFKPNEYGGFLFPREPLYVCHRCLPRYQTDARVTRMGALRV